MNSVHSLGERISAHPFMRAVPARHIGTLAECAMDVSFVAGETIFRQGDPANRFYLVESGTIALEALNGVRVRVQVIGPGEVLGWSWLCPPYRWQFEARALEPIRAVFLYGSRLRELCELDTDLGFYLFKAITAISVERLQATRRCYLQKLAKKELD